jgi:signal transduction histidine kinase
LGADTRLFERFVRAAGEEPGESGLGLGLWLVKSIVERHGGSVVAKRLPRGTRVEVELPKRAAP